jgi:hypothetical protein
MIMSFKLYTIVLTHLIGRGQGKQGYHSVWNSSEKANSVATALNKKYGREYRYDVNEISTFSVKQYLGGVNFNECQGVRLKDSVGWMNISDGDSEWISRLLEDRGVSFGKFEKGVFIAKRMFHTGVGR